MAFPNATFSCRWIKMLQHVASENRSKRVGWKIEILCYIQINYILKHASLVLGESLWGYFAEQMQRSSCHRNFGNPNVRRDVCIYPAVSGGIEAPQMQGSGLCRRHERLPAG